MAGCPLPDQFMVPRRDCSTLRSSFVCWRGRVTLRKWGVMSWHENGMQTFVFGSGTGRDRRRWATTRRVRCKEYVVSGSRVCVLVCTSLVLLLRYGFYRVNRAPSLPCKLGNVNKRA